MESYGHKEESKDKLKVVTIDPPDGAEPIDLGICEMSKDIHWEYLNHASRRDKYGAMA